MGLGFPCLGTPGLGTLGLGTPGQNAPPRLVTFAMGTHIWEPPSWTPRD